MIRLCYKQMDFGVFDKILTVWQSERTDKSKDKKAARRRLA
ncbi:hypothetical protein VVAX_00372 [Variovorax paradoxus]|jgi:hypothetical protein|uniref:Uncharacterized protein n=1 Tax=Variovorax paradoxus TaxID=34073 RepID=A0A679IME5_VARPD|nr:hypothetical protein VVAX_00372 [Variovorax paradoxus]